MSSGSRNNYIHRAVENDDVDVIDHWIKKGMTNLLDQKNAEGLTPFQLASKMGRTASIRYFENYYGKISDGHNAGLKKDSNPAPPMFGHGTILNSAIDNGRIGESNVNIENNGRQLFGDNCSLNLAARCGEIGEANVNICNSNNPVSGCPRHDAITFGNNCTVNSTFNGGQISSAYFSTGNVNIPPKKK